MHKRSRTAEEKIEDCLDNAIGNLHPKFREQLYQVLLNNPEKVVNVHKSKQYIYSLYKFPERGIGTKQYWLARGWTKGESHYKSKQSNPRKKTTSPFSKEFWVEKINPNTGTNYTEIEADYKRNSQRPIRKEYWLELGHSEQESIELAITQKNNNNISGTKSMGGRDKDSQKASSPRCKEYYMLRGFTEEESIDKVSDAQMTFSLDICIKKHGSELGRQVWLDRQERWHKNYKKSNFSKIGFFPEIASIPFNTSNAEFDRLSIITTSNPSF